MILLSTPDEWAAALAAVKPGAERKALYARYRSSKCWKAKRAQALERAGHACQVCAATTVELHVHHRTYERCGNEDLADLTVLCFRCHNLFHKKTKPKQQKKQSKPKPLAGVLTPSVRAGVLGYVMSRHNGESFTTGRVQRGVVGKMNTLQVKAALDELIDQGIVVKVRRKKGQYMRKRGIGKQKPPKKKTRSDAVVIVARLIYESPRSLTAVEIEKDTYLSRAHVDAAIGSLNYRGEIQRHEGGWKKTAKLRAVLDANPTIEKDLDNAWDEAAA